MESITDQPPLIVVAGQTASGKSSMALDLARHFDIEIIAADARSVYKGMDIGTAKPTTKERHTVPHHLLDIVRPGEIFTVADFKRLAQAKIQEIAGRGKLPVMVGGSGLYIYAVVYDFAFRGPPDHAERRRLERLSVEQLQSLVQARGLPMPANTKNPRHLIGVLETGKVAKGQNSLRPNTLLLGKEIDTDKLVQNIHDRTFAMIEQGLEQEVRQLATQYGWDVEALSQTIGYEEFRPYFEGGDTLANVIQNIEVRTRRLAKRQKTWFRRNKDMHWISKPEEAVDLVTTFLNK